MIILKKFQNCFSIFDKQFKKNCCTYVAFRQVKDCVQILYFHREIYKNIKTAIGG